MGPLHGIKVIEMNAIGPVPHAGMLLADMGAEVVVVDRPRDAGQLRPKEIHRRGKLSVVLDVKDDKDQKKLMTLIDRTDLLLEGFRPGVMERLGLGPAICCDRNPGLIYGRMTGWGQQGPLSHAAGHDINYIALTGALHAVGPKEANPVPPLNLVGDFGGGSLYLVAGLLAALVERAKSGKGQVVDAAMTDGSAHLMSMFHSLRAMDLWSTTRGANLLDGGAHFYNTYATKDQKYVAIGPIEPKFYEVLKNLVGLDESTFGAQYDRDNWPNMKRGLAAIFRLKTREEWCALLEGTDACFAPVLDLTEAPRHPHNRARGTYVDIEGVVQPAPAPRFNRTPSGVKHPPKPIGGDSDAVWESWVGGIRN